MAQLSSGEISLKFFCTIDFLSFSSITLRVFSTSDFVLQDFVVYGLVTLWSLSTKVFFFLGQVTPGIFSSKAQVLSHTNGDDETATLSQKLLRSGEPRNEHLADAIELKIDFDFSK